MTDGLKLKQQAEHDLGNHEEKKNETGKKQ